MFSYLHVIYITFLSIFFSAISVFSADKSSTHDFIKINEINGSIESAFTSYISSDGKTIIELIGVLHIATPSFYDAVHNKMKNQVVLYEMAGHSIEDQRELIQRIASFGQNYQKIWNALYVNEIPDSIGCVRQTRYFSFDGCAELIHADKKENWCFSSLSDEDLKDKILFAAFTKFLERGIKFGSPEELLHKINRLPLLEAADVSKKSQSNLLRRSVQEIFEDEISIALGNTPEGLFKHFGENWREYVDDRHEIIFQRLKEMWARKEVPVRIIIPYGVAHMPYVEEFLKKNNYRLKDKEWLAVAQLCAESKVSFEAIEKIYVSSDELLKLYLKDTHSDDQVSENDAAFVQDTIMGNLGTNDGKVDEISFAPTNFEYVEENLLRQGFKLLSVQKL